MTAPYLSCRPEGSTEHISTLDTERLAQGVSNVLLAITPRLRDFHSLLVDPPKVISSLIA